jgi:hypothetical protein
MMRLSRGARLLPGLLAVLLALAGCQNGVHDSGMSRGTPTGLPPVQPDATGGEATGSSTGGNPTIKEIMTKLTKGPASLTTVIGKELEAEPTPWDTIQGQTPEFVRLARALGQDNPPRGSKDSWAKLTTAYADSAVALDRAAQAKDHEAAVAAQKQLKESCTGCHNEHRPRRPGGGP